jgi:hypothetical protein
MDLKEKKQEEEIKDDGCPNPIKPESQKEDNISKMNKIINDNNVEEKVFDLLFVIDATGSMSSYITAAKDETENISMELRHLYPEYNFQYGYVFYRDPIDSPEDIHEIINLTDKVNTLPNEIKKIKAYGGGDIPEDWVGAFKLANEKINWRNGLRVIIHLADAGAHGKEFTLSDKYPEESEKLKAELLKCSKNNIKIFGYVITEDARNSFNKCQNYYRSKGGSYEIYEFKISKDISDDSDDDAKYYKTKSSKKEKCKKAKKNVKEKRISKKKESEDYDEDSEDNEDKKISSKQKEINSVFKTRVIHSIKSVFS